MKNLGTFETIDEVWRRYPEGGRCGECVTVGGETLHWNKYTESWGGEIGQSGARTIDRVDGDMIVGNDLIVGGRLYVRKGPDDGGGGDDDDDDGGGGSEIAFDAFLRKDRDDKSEHQLTVGGGVVTSGVRSADFKSGAEDGKGFSLTEAEDGTSTLEVDALKVRKKATFAELVINEMSWEGGDKILSKAGCKIEKVCALTNGRKGWKCYWPATDEDGTATHNLWKAGDQARCQCFDKGGKGSDGSRYYFRLVTEAGTRDGMHYVTLSDEVTETIGGVSCAGCEMTAAGGVPTSYDIPKEGDSIVQMGSQTDPDRMYFYAIYVSESRRADYVGVNDYDIESHLKNEFAPKKITLHADSVEIVSMASPDVRTSPVCERGAWRSGDAYAHYDRVSHGGCMWLCIAAKGSITTEEPKEGSAVWLKEIDKGESPILIEITTSNGSVLRNSEGRTTLTAHVRQGTEDITERFAATQFSWTRQSANTDSDKSWNAIASHKGVREITVDASEVFERAVFECTLTDWA